MKIQVRYSDDNLRTSLPILEKLFLGTKIIFTSTKVVKVKNIFEIYLHFDGIKLI